MIETIDHIPNSRMFYGFGENSIRNKIQGMHEDLLEDFYKIQYSWQDPVGVRIFFSVQRFRLCGMFESAARCTQEIFAKS